MRASRTFILLALGLLAVPALTLAGARSADCLGAVPVSMTTLEDLGIAPQEALAPGAPLPAACIGKIQPGSHMVAPVGCTMNWVFQDETGALYIGTAGHCLGATGTAPSREVSVELVGKIGRGYFNVNAGPGNDFGLVKIDPAKYHLVDPTLCYWGGPSKQAEFDTVPVHDTVPVLPPFVLTGFETTGTTPLLQYGFGFVTSSTSAGRARVQYSHSYGANSFSVDGLISSGDSGSPNMFADGGAAGIITHASFGVPGAALGPGSAVRIDRAIALAEAATGHDFTLVTSDVPVRAPFADLGA